MNYTELCLNITVHALSLESQLRDLKQLHTHVLTTPAFITILLGFLLIFYLALNFTLDLHLKRTVPRFPRHQAKFEYLSPGPRNEAEYRWNSFQDRFSMNEIQQNVSDDNQGETVHPGIENDEVVLIPEEPNPNQ